jgi:Na+/H+ antiporter
MKIFETLLILLGLAVLLLQLAKKFNIPYPVMLAFAGCLVGALPWVPEFLVEPHLALALFITPALFDAAFDTTRTELKRNWIPLMSLVVFAVILTTLAVAWVGVVWAGIPLAAAVTLGAIVAPPDAAAVSAVLRDANLPKRTTLILEGESLLNDAVVLLIYGIASSIAMDSSKETATFFLPYLFAIPGGALIGWVWARIFVRISPIVAQALSSTILEFVMTFGIWVIAEKLHLSAILAVVIFAMTVAKYLPEKQSARDRVHSYSIWEATVFILNVTAFLMMGLMAKNILQRIKNSELLEALVFSGIILLVVVLVRMAWVLLFRTLGQQKYPLKNAILVSWCGIRGLLTISTALALPMDFPKRDLIVLTAFAVVVGTLILQGLSLNPLINWLKLKRTSSDENEMINARIAMIDAGIKVLALQPGSVAEVIKKEFEFEKDLSARNHSAFCVSEFDQIRLVTIKSQREVLSQWRKDDRIDDNTYHRLEEELDWAELAASSQKDLQLFNH